jgi:hypothetical protein
MLLFWRIRYLDTRDKQFKNRDLWLETNDLEPVGKAAVELVNEARRTDHGRDMLRFRHLFREGDKPALTAKEICEKHGGMEGFCLPDYLEDENGNELTNKQTAVILTGNPEAVMFPGSFRPHDVEYCMAEPRPIPLRTVSVPQDSLAILGYFARDVRELMESAFLRDGPGTLTSAGPALQTAVTDEEIRSFVTIFRRLYMTGEPAGFLKAVNVFAACLAGYPLTRWIEGTARQYESELQARPRMVPYADGGFPFTRKRLIDVFLYTQYAHQPDTCRQRQFQECLSSVGNRMPVLTWLFLRELWECSLHIINAGRIIADFCDRYCQCHGTSPAVLGSLSQDNPALGVLEKKDVQRKRLFLAKSQEIARSLWEKNGRPSDGPEQFLGLAMQQLSHVTGEEPVDVGQFNLEPVGRSRLEGRQSSEGHKR